jgi:hypothetical protein
MDARLSRHPQTGSLSSLASLASLSLALLLAAVSGLAPSVASAQGAGADTLVLYWTAPGDDGTVGTAHHYEVRMSVAAITNSNWSAAPLIGGAPAPLPSGERQRMVVRGLSRDSTYYFAVKTVDHAGNVSELSNVVQWNWVYDTAPPSAPSGLTAQVEGATRVRVRWSPNGEPDLSGYTVYRRESPSGSPTAVSPTLVAGTEFLDTTIPAGVTQVWYQVSATDQSGNESAYSAMVAVTLAEEASAEFTLHAVYPNPSRSNQSVNIPVDLPAGGAGDASLHVYDRGSRLVRILSVPDLGGPSVVVWDGRNDAGLLAAPGVYVVRLNGPGVHRMTKVVRLP